VLEQGLVEPRTRHVIEMPRDANDQIARRACVGQVGAITRCAGLDVDRRRIDWHEAPPELLQQTLRTVLRDGRRARTPHQQCGRNTAEARGNASRTSPIHGTSLLPAGVAPLTQRKPALCKAGGRPGHGDTR